MTDDGKNKAMNSPGFRKGKTNCQELENQKEGVFYYEEYIIRKG